MFEITKNDSGNDETLQTILRIVVIVNFSNIYDAEEILRCCKIDGITPSIALIVLLSCLTLYLQYKACMEHMTSETLFIHKLPVYETPYYKTGCQFKSSLLRLKYIFKCGQAGSRTASRKLTRLTTCGFAIGKRSAYSSF